MFYEEYTSEWIFSEITTEEDARELIWRSRFRALFYVMQGKRGMPALALQRHLGLKSYGLVWTILQKIRMALQQRDKDDQVGDGVVELDAGTFGKRETGNQNDVLVAIESNI